MLTSHAPQAIATRQVRKQALTPGYAEFAERHAEGDLTYLGAPVIRSSACAGIMQFTFSRPITKIPREAIAAITVHVSSRLSALAAMERIAVWDGVLTSRELDVAAVAARGFSNQQAALQLGVSANTIKKHLKSIYGKLAVGSRVDLALRLALGPSTPAR